MGRAQPRDPSAFLINQDRRILSSDGSAKLAAKASHLGRFDAIACEQDEAERIGVDQESSFRFAQVRTGNPEDGGAWPKLRRFSHWVEPRCS